ncbi:MAG: SGNH/GDSL hydrolase family protein [Oligosphaeraceae bacterium]|nr:SGNH/GDSL hydrolase family protein [Oligosphaeraceae bacterium]
MMKFAKMKTLLSLFTLICTTLSMHADAKVEADLERIADHVNKKTQSPWTWVFYGDSITHGAGHTDGRRSFPEIFHERARWEYHLSKDAVINSGTSGDTTFGLLDENEYRRRVKRYDPQVVFVLIGFNDGNHPKCNGPDGFRARIEKLVERIQGDGAIVVLQTYNTVDVHARWGEKNSYVIRWRALVDFNRIIRETAKKYSTILVDHDEYWKEHAADPKILKSWLGEYVHPGAQGHLEMANLIFKTLNMYDPKSRCSNVDVGTAKP